jgi:mevalonate kinase
MPATSASAPGKVILFGEHAVVYGQPAIAVPVTQVRAKGIITPLIQGPPGAIQIEAPAIGLHANLDELAADDPIGAALAGAFAALGVEQPPAFKLKVTSTIPVASGLGSGAAVSVAIIRVVAAFLGHPLADDQVSEIAFEVEKLHHGTPSGIDNSVVTYAQPVYFIKDRALETLKVAAPFTLVIGDTGVSSPTRDAVGDLRAAWQADPRHYDSIFAAVGDIARQARATIESGDTGALGPLMDANHGHLQTMRVSSRELDALVEAARAAGALGAKLSGGGRGGNMIALVDESTADAVAAALQAAGATNTIVSTVT